MELNVFTEQLQQCYNILAQQFVLIKQLKDLTINDKNKDNILEAVETSINRIDEILSTIVNDYVSKDNFEELVRETPTDVRVVKDQNKWQLQLEHDSNVLSIDEGLQTALDSVSGGVQLYKHILELRFADDKMDYVLISKSNEAYNLQTLLTAINNDNSIIYCMQKEGFAGGYQHLNTMIFPNTYNGLTLLSYADDFGTLMQQVFEITSITQDIVTPL